MQEIIIKLMELSTAKNSLHTLIEQKFRELSVEERERVLMHLDLSQTLDHSYYLRLKDLNYT